MNQSVAKTAHCLNRSRQTIHKVYLFFKQGKSALEYYQQYKKTNQTVVDVRLFYRGTIRIYSKKGCSRMDTDVIVGRAAFPISCSARTIYRMFKRAI